jgi:molybdenum cofactor cytidylyltransferase
MPACAAVLAAGGGRRFHGDGPKLLAPFRGRPLVAWAVDAAGVSGLPVIVVQGAVDLGTALPPGVVVVTNPRWSEGIATSLQTAVAAAAELGYDSVVVGLGDQPLVPGEAWAAVAASDAVVAVATYDGRRRNPVRLAASVWPLLPETGDEGARALVRARPDLVTEVACAGDPVDVDTVEDLSRWS